MAKTSIALAAIASLSLLHAQTIDKRNIRTGSVIPDEGYSDQPYIVKTADGAWLCVITTGRGVEGAGGQHVVTRRSMDLGKTWSAPSWRVYVFDNHNTGNLRQVIRQTYI